MPLEPGQLPPPLVIEREAPEELRNHTVLPGEHFWGIAEQVVAERGLTVSVADYWRLLIEANRSRLVDPDDPDLIHPGQVLVLP
jgi:nucleoid-associated protein YgaU